MSATIDQARLEEFIGQLVTELGARSTPRSS